jgi:hypothetical protein
MIHENQQPPTQWDSRREESSFAELEERFSHELRGKERFEKTAPVFAIRLKEIVRALPSGYSTNFLVDVICSANCLCLRAWQDYVKSNWENEKPEAMVSLLYQLPRLEDYMSSLGLDPKLTRRFPTLVKDELVSRNAYADGARRTDYINKYMVQVQAPNPSLLIVPQTDTQVYRDFFGNSTTDLELFGSSFVDHEDSRKVTAKRFHLLQKFSIGRQKGKEPPPFNVVYGDRSHRMIIAEKNDSKVASREQLELIVLTPQILYFRNPSGHFPIELLSLKGSSILDLGESCMSLSDVTIRCEKLRLEVIPMYSS